MSLAREDLSVAPRAAARAVNRVKLHIIPSGPIETNAYLLCAPERGEAVLIDAPGGIWDQVVPLLEASGCRLRELWLTHGHWDHMQGAAEVVRHSGATVRAHPADRELITHPAQMSRFMRLQLELEPVSVDSWLAAGQALAALGETFAVRHVPGHCPGNVMFYSAALRAAFVGDALFRDGVGRWDLPGGDFDELAASIRTQIYTLPHATTVFPGHGETTTVEREATGNPYVSGT